MINEAKLAQMWGAAINGDKAAINGLYMIALQGLPRVQGRSPDSRHQIICDAAWEVLSKATSDEPGAKRWVTEDGRVTLKGFKKSVVVAVGDRASEKTVQRFINDPEEMSGIVQAYRDIYGLEKA